MTFADADSSSERQRPMSAIEEMLAPIRTACPLSTEFKIIVIVFAVLATWAAAILTLGAPALVWPMKFIAPAFLVGLIAIT